MSCVLTESHCRLILFQWGNTVLFKFHQVFSDKQTVILLQLQSDIDDITWRHPRHTIYVWIFEIPFTTRRAEDSSVARNQLDKLNVTVVCPRWRRSALHGRSWHTAISALFWRQRKHRRCVPPAQRPGIRLSNIIYLALTKILSCNVMNISYNMQIYLKFST